MRQPYDDVDDLIFTVSFLVLCNRLCIFGAPVLLIRAPQQILRLAKMTLLL